VTNDTEKLETLRKARNAFRSSYLFAGLTIVAGMVDLAVAHSPIYGWSLIGSGVAALGLGVIGQRTAQRQLDEMDP